MCMAHSSLRDDATPCTERSLQTNKINTFQFNMMQNTNSYKFILQIAVSLLFLTCCTKKDNCSDWYEGVDCIGEERAKYYGSYNGKSYVYDANGELISTLQFEDFNLYPGNAINELDLGSLKLTLTTPGSNSFIIPNTDFIGPDGNNYNGQGSGNFNGITFYFTLYPENNPLSFTYYGTKQ